MNGVQENQKLGYGQIQKQVQKLAMTQQMQQSIQLLRYSSEDLVSFLKQKELDNPFIFIKDSFTYTGEISGIKNSQSSIQQFEFNSDIKKQSLYNYLIAQIKLTMRKTDLRSWVIYLAGQVDQNGYLKIDFDELIKRTKVEKVVLLDALTLLQQLDPPGVGARSLQECLLLQIQDAKDVPQKTYEVVQKKFDYLIEHDWKKITEELNITLEETREIFEFIRKLSASPGGSFNQESTTYVYPDIIVTRHAENSEFSIKATKRSNPTVHFKKEYYDKLKNNDDQAVANFLKEKKKDFQELVRDIEQRNQTVVKVAQIIVEQQRTFFETGNGPLKPLLLRDVAQRLDMHESTVSRAVNGKYLRCDYGVFELKGFLRRPISSKNNNISVEIIKEYIRKFIADEDLKKPFSDVKLCEKLREVQITVSRRAINKYREEMGIGSSIERKKKYEMFNKKDEK